MTDKNFFGKHNLPGTYIAFEGPEGCGKSTQLYWLARNLQEKFPGREIVRTFEPGGTPTSDRIRNEVLGKREGEKEMEPTTEALLFAASRSESLAKIVKPALERGAIVISDRSIFSSLAYQGFGRKMGWEHVWGLNKPVVGLLVPDLIIFPKVPPEVGLRRIFEKRQGKFDRLDGQDIDFHRLVSFGFDYLAMKFPELFLVVDGELSIEQQAEIISEGVYRLLFYGEDYEATSEMNRRYEERMMASRRERM